RTEKLAQEVSIPGTETDPSNRQLRTPRDAAASAVRLEKGHRVESPLPAMESARRDMSCFARCRTLNEDSMTTASAVPFFRGHGYRSHQRGDSVPPTFLPRKAILTGSPPR